ncbi:hypothetical protein FNV43_RR19275 [Rhamnella rubrinervis]|uniref:GPN-loop GTPase 3 n=1 Tax=Rhamnella rubrinervis TaxID=2594499 RepID=A0A8K0E7V3_9ROSA|nr:hypothetical protein FNV43_RR19275 [Rhamnella rubrinervis]
MGYAQLVIGPAGSGKSTYCSSLYQHCQTVGRTVHIVNLDPAAENFDYPVAMDVRELISLDDVMEELGLGPNGGLIYCMEHLDENLDDWLTAELDNYLDDDYLVFDCPGQIELFHMSQCFELCGAFEGKTSMFVVYICLIHSFLNPEPQSLLLELNQRMGPQFAKLNKSLIELVNDYSMVSFVPLDLRKESSIQYVLAQIDSCIQYGEDADVKLRTSIQTKIRIEVHL